MVQTSFIVALVAILSATSNVIALPVVDVSGARDVEVRSTNGAKYAKKFAEELGKHAWDHKNAKDVLTGHGPISSNLKDHPAEHTKHNIHTPLVGPGIQKLGPIKLASKPALSHEMQESLNAWRNKATKKV